MELDDKAFREWVQVTLTMMLAEAQRRGEWTVVDALYRAKNEVLKADLPAHLNPMPQEVRDLVERGFKG